MIPVVWAAWAGSVAVWMTTSARFLRLWRFLEDELLARLQIDVQEKYSRQGKHDDAHEESVHSGYCSVHNDAGDARQGHRGQKNGKHKHHGHAPRSSGVSP